MSWFSKSKAYNAHRFEPDITANEGKRAILKSTHTKWKILNWHISSIECIINDYIPTLDTVLKIALLAALISIIAVVVLNFLGYNNPTVTGGAFAGAVTGALWKKGNSIQQHIL